jgi:hypothetical protein
MRLGLAIEAVPFDTTLEAAAFALPDDINTFTAFKDIDFNFRAFFNIDSFFVDETEFAQVTQSRKLLLLQVA